MIDTESSAGRRGNVLGSVPDHPHACMDGLVFLTYVAFDEEIGDEVERIEVIPCRRCAEAIEEG